MHVVILQIHGHVVHDVVHDVGMVCPINAIDMLEILYIIKFDTEHPHIHLKQQDYKLPVHFVLKIFGEQFAIAPIRIVH